MKLAVPTKENNVDSHFGHCEYYSIYTIGDNKEVVNKQTLPSPQGCGCKSDIAIKLRDLGVTVMLAGNMGEGAKNVLEGSNIKVIRGCSGNVDDLIKSYVLGELSDSGLMCEHNHSDGHVCQNHK